MRLRRFRKLRRNRNYATMVLVAFVGILSVMGIGYSYLQQRLSMDISLSKKNNEEFVEDYFAYIIASKNVNGNAEGLYTDEHGDIRYRGSDSEVKNYVLFNNEIYRVIGIFDGGYVKLYKEDSIGNMAWNSSGENNWTQSSLYQYLNINFYQNLGSSNRNLITRNRYYLGQTELAPNTASGWYSAERSSNVHSGYSTYTMAYVGLLYPSDYGYAGAPECNQETSFSDCNVNYNWLYNSSYFWFLNSSLNNTSEVYMFRIPGYIGATTASDSTVEVYPVFYLKYNVVCNGGTGTSTDPYTLSTTLGPLTTDPINNPMNPHPTSTATTTGTGTGTGGTTGPTTGTGTPTTGTPTTGTPTTTRPTTGTPQVTTTPPGTVTPTTTTPIMTTSNSPVTTPNY